MENPFFVPDYWREHGGALVGAIALLALIVGSFLNVVILRLPLMMDRGWRRECNEMLATPPLMSSDEPISLLFPASSCPSCGHKIRPWENVPVVSWIALRGRCSACRERISFRYPLIEMLTALVSVAVALRFGFTGLLPAALVFTWALLALAVIDIDHQLLPDSITMPLLWGGLLLNSGGMVVPLGQAVWGAALGYLSLWSVYWLFRLATGKEGMGYGDFKLLAALGAWLGWQALPMVIILSSACGAVVGLALIVLRGRDRNVPIPFGPWLALGGWIMMMWGEQLRGQFF